MAPPVPTSRAERPPAEFDEAPKADDNPTNTRDLSAGPTHRAGAHALVAGVVGHLVGLDQIATAQLGRVETQMAGQPIHHPLDDEVADLAPAAANEASRDGVGVDQAGLRIQSRQSV